MRVHFSTISGEERYLFKDLFSNLSSITQDKYPSVASNMCSFLSVYLKRQRQALESLLHYRIGC